MRRCRVCGEVNLACLLLQQNLRALLEDIFIYIHIYIYIFREREQPVSTTLPVHQVPVQHNNLGGTMGTMLGAPRFTERKTISTRSAPA